MDFFGIGAGIKGCAMVYIQAARRTGRTISMINSLKDGDRVVFHNSNEADRVERLCRERGIKINAIVVPVEKPNDLFQRGTSQGRTIFDHSWVENYYLNGISRMEKDIAFFEKAASGWQEAHETTKRQAIELSKWQL